VDHTGDGTTPTDGQLIPDYRQLGFRVPAIVVSNLAEPAVIHHGPFEHTSTLKLIESTFGLNPLTARDTNAENLGQVLRPVPRRPVPAGAIPTSSQVLGPVSDPAAICSAGSVPSVAPKPLRHGRGPHTSAVLPQSGWPTGAGLAAFARQQRGESAG
jgi:phospholipase C